MLILDVRSSLSDPVFEGVILRWSAYILPKLLKLFELRGIKILHPESHPLELIVGQGHLRRPLEQVDLVEGSEQARPEGDGSMVLHQHHIVTLPIRYDVPGKILGPHQCIGDVHDLFDEEVTLSGQSGVDQAGALTGTEDRAVDRVGVDDSVDIRSFKQQESVHLGFDAQSKMGCMVGPVEPDDCYHICLKTALVQA